MDNITSLGIAVDSSEVKQASQELDRLSVSGDKAERSIRTLGKSGDAYTAQMNAIYRASKATRTVQVELNEEQEKFISSLQRQIETVGLSRSKLLEFRAAELGVSDQAKSLISQLEAATASTKKVTTGAHGAGEAMEGFSLKTAQARRELIVMLREAGRGDFGRLAGSASLFAQATGLMGMVMTPTGLAIAGVTAAVGALAIAYVKGAEESAAFSRAISLSGGYAGVTEGQYDSLAKSISDSTDTTIGSAREVTLELLKSGRFGADALTITAKATENLSKVSGEETSKIVKDFINMADGVTNWAEKANKSYHFLTAAQLEHIKTLEDQGKTQEAIITVMSALNQRLESSTTNLGYLETAWNGVKKAASAAIDAMLSIGRTDTTEALIAKTRRDIELLGQGGMVHQGGDAAYKAVLQEQLRLLLRAKDAQEGIAKSKQEAVETENADLEVMKLREKYQKREVTMAKELAAAEAKFNKPGVSQEGRAEVMAAIREKYKPRAGAKPPDRTNIDAKAQLALDVDEIRKKSDVVLNSFNQAQRLMEASRAAGLIDDATYYAARKAFVFADATVQEKALQDEIDRLGKMKFVGNTATADQLENDRKITDAKAKLAKVREAASISTQILTIEEASAANKLSESYRNAEDAAQNYIDSIRRAQAAELAGVGKGSAERNRVSGRAQIEDKYDQQRRDLEKTRRDAEAAGTFGVDAQAKYNNELALIQKFQSTALKEYDAYFKERRAMEQDALLGAQEALQNYLDESSNILGQTEGAVGNALKGMEDAFVAFATTGKLSFKSLANSIIADIARIIVKQSIVTPMANWIMGSLSGGYLSKLFGGGAASTMLHAANGGTFGANQLVNVNENGPELFSVGDKQYLMTGSQGGTVTPNGGSGGGTTVIQNFTVGDVASMAQVKAAVAASQRQMLGAQQRSMNYGGAMSA